MEPGRQFCSIHPISVKGGSTVLTRNVHPVTCDIFIMDDTKDRINQFLRSHSGKLVSALVLRWLRILNIHIRKKLVQKNATGAVVFNPSDYCPYSDVCLSFQSHARGMSGSKGVQSHLRKAHADTTYYLLPCMCWTFCVLDR